MVELTGYITNILNDVAHQIINLPNVEMITFNVAVILIIAALFGFVAKLLKQPLISAYIITGLIIGPLVLGLVSNTDLIYAFSEIGIAFLLFVTGLEMSFRSIREVNLRKIVFIGFLQVGIIFGITILLRNFLGLDILQAAYIGMILALSSTIINVKLLADKNELLTLHGRLVLGILLIQDLIAIVAIVIFSIGSLSIVPIVFAFAKLLLIVGVAFFLHKFILNKIFSYAARSSELLFLSSLAVLFLFIILSYISELSIVIGAFIAGISIANSKFKPEVESRILPLRDFFSILFFVILGMQFVFEGIGSRLVLLFSLLAITLIVNPMITFILLRITGYHQKTSFLASLSLSQISEFSLKIGMLGIILGVLDSSIFSIVILTTIITMSLTPYFIKHNDSLYKIFKSPLRIFKFLPMSENLEYGKTKSCEILLVGSHRIGSSLLKDLIHKKDKLLVVDYDPEIINVLIKNKIPCIYGDIYSSELLSKTDINKLKIVVSTVPGYKENLYLLKMIKRLNKRIKVIVTGSRISDAEKLYSQGAEYVIMPKILAGDEISHILSSRKPDFSHLRKRHLRHIKGLHKVLY